MMSTKGRNKIIDYIGYDSINSRSVSTGKALLYGALYHMGNECSRSFCEGIEELLGEMKSAHSEGNSRKLTMLMNSVSMRLTHMFEDINFMQNIQAMAGKDE